MKHQSFTGTLVSFLAVVACSSSGEENGGGGGDGGNGSGSGGFAAGFNSGGAGAASGAGSLDDLRNSACAEEVAAGEPSPSLLQLVVDVSGSMDNDAPGSNRSKWQETRDALEVAIENLPASTALGVLYYPNRGTNASDSPRDVSECVSPNGRVAVDLLHPAQRDAVLESLRDINGPQGGTPTHDAYGEALADLGDSTLPGQRFILLITDGQPTFSQQCLGTGRVQDAVDPRPIVDAVQAARNTNVKTFVIGSPGSEEVGVPVFDDARTWLSMAASLGGTATPGCSDDGPNFCHFDMSQEQDFSTALRGALEAIAGQVVSCTYSIPVSETLDPAKVNVIFTPEGGDSTLIPKTAGDTCAEGWRFTANDTLVELCESTCNLVQSNPNPRVEILIGCASETEPLE